MGRALRRLATWPPAAPPAASVLLALALASACGSNNNTQPSSTTATLSGKITDAKTGAALAQAIVTSQGKSATTASDGTFSVTGLTAGSATMSVQHQGHDTASQSVTLTSGSTTTANLAMTPALAAALAGNWSGSWHNNLSNTTGAAGLVISADTIAQTFQTSLTLNGIVFGLGNAPPLTFGGSYTVTGGAANITATSVFFGSLTISISATGQITGSLVNPVGGITRVDFTGTATGTTISVNYTVTFNGGGQATGTLTLTRPV